MRDKSAGRKLFEDGAGGGGEFAGLNGFLDFWIHAGGENRNASHCVQAIFRTQIGGVENGRVKPSTRSALFEGTIKPMLHLISPGARPLVPRLR
jgi:hypothetical protein